MNSMRVIDGKKNSPRRIIFTKGIASLQKMIYSPSKVSFPLQNILPFVSFHHSLTNILAAFV